MAAMLYSREAPGLPTSNVSHVFPDRGHTR